MDKSFKKFRAHIIREYKRIKEVKWRIDNVRATTTHKELNDFLIANYHYIRSINPKGASKKFFDSLSTNDWMKLVSHYPEYILLCDMSIFDLSEMNIIMARQPQLLMYYDYNNLSSWFWVSVLSHNPKSGLDKVCPWHKLNGDMWSDLLEWRPDLAKHCDWNKLSGGEWKYLLIRQPQFKQYCDFSKFTSQNAESLLTFRPSFIFKCDTTSFNGFSWVSLLRKHPRLAKYCDFNKLTNKDWWELLEKQPQLSKHRI
jgi:hypothetical protein